ncbi:MAG: PKD domain-containing protein [Gemmatimonadetes bacterium]|nr:PKD domain-containing protein [Gemmatimonadota bacterium]
MIATVTDKDGGVGADTATVRVVPVNRRPVGASGGPYAGDEASVISMSASGSLDHDGDALSYAWDFGDGGTATGLSTSHSYRTFGAFPVRLIVTDSYGLADTVSTTATINNLPPVASAGPDFSLPVGSNAFPAFSFTDPGLGDGPWQVQVNWGGPGGSGGPVNQPGTIGSGTVTTRRAPTRCSSR